MDFQHLFCDNPDLLDHCSNTLSEHLLGKEILAKIELRYKDLKANFNAVTYDEWNSDGDYPLWRFSSGVTPYMDYDDTSIVPIPITNKLFKNENVVISFDFPVWFNMTDGQAQRIMFITQSPISREITCYNKCRDVLCSTMFGLHNPLWRNKGNGGKRMWMLAKSLIEKGYSVYFTDCYKFAIQTDTGVQVKPSKPQILAYRNILVDEIKFVNPNLIVTLGNIAAKIVSEFVNVRLQLLKLPHFSGQAQAAIKSFFKVGAEEPFDISTQANLYHDIILESLK
ncbi:MAG: uracil-DNA glycosylase family protein [Muribaculaceae bacterium]|nr:uracil-DNA glycosylase family protein [Muribaculaceae bacterium]